MSPAGTAAGGHRQWGRGLTHVDPGVRDTARRALAGLLADARGVPVQAGQFLANFEGNEAFSVLSEGIPAMPLEAELPQLERDLGCPVEEVFSEFSEEAAAASLGQVHRAWLREENTDVAVKVQYPDIGRAVDAEMRIAKLFPGIGPVRRWGFDLHSYKDVLHQNILAELDYAAEAERQRCFHETMCIAGLQMPQELFCVRLGAKQYRVWPE